MKKAIFLTAILALLLYGRVAIGQEIRDYYPRRQWNITMCNYGVYSQSEIYTGIDTMLNGVLSSQIYENGLYVGSYFKEDGKCYFIDTLNNTRVLYDYGLQPGDTVPWITVLNEYSGDVMNLIVDSVITLQISGDEKKAIFFRPLSDGVFRNIRECWIEDIGSVHGFLFPTRFQLLEEESQQKCDLTCFFQEDVLVWMNAQYEECGVGLREDEKESAMIYPNPVTDVLNVFISEKNANEKICIKIFDSIGHFLKGETILGGELAQIDVSTLPQGLYVIHFYNKSKQIKSVKLIKN